eukprot:452613-Hanusia_phi.AAC.5
MSSAEATRLSLLEMYSATCSRTSRMPWGFLSTAPTTSIVRLLTWLSLYAPVPPGMLLKNILALSIASWGNSFCLPCQPAPPNRERQIYLGLGHVHQVRVVHEREHLGRVKKVAQAVRTEQPGGKT